MPFVATYTCLLINTQANNRNKDLMHLVKSLITCTLVFFHKKDVTLVPNDYTHSRAKTNYAEYKTGL